MFIFELQRCKPCHERSGITLLEVLISAFLVGVVIVAALNVSTSSMQAQILLGSKGHALFMAQDLLTEIESMPYRDPNGTSVFSAESNANTNTRADFDDVDDYRGWTCSPPTRKDGSPLAAPDSWERNVTVEFVDPDDISHVVGSDLGGKRITVTVMRASTELVKLTNVVFEPVN